MPSRKTKRILLSLFLSVLSSSVLFGSYRSLDGHILTASEQAGLIVYSAALLPSGAAGYLKSQTRLLNIREDSNSRSGHPTQGSLTVNCNCPKDNLLAGWMPVSNGQQLVTFFFGLVLAGRSPPSAISLHQ